MLPIHTKRKLNYKNPEKQLLIWKKWIKNSLEKKFKMIKQAGMNKFYTQYKTTRHTQRGTKCNEEFCQKAPLSVRSFLGLQSLCLKFSKSTIPVKNYTNKRNNYLIYKEDVVSLKFLYCMFHDKGSQVWYYMFPSTLE